MAEVTSREYLDYLVATYAGRPRSYYAQFLRSPLRPGDAVLDWGCGLGGMLEHLATFSPKRLAGVDLNPDCVDYVRKRHSEWEIELLASPGLRSSFASGSFDRVLLLDVLEHVQHPRLLLEECHRLLKPGGTLTLSTPDRLAFHKQPGTHPYAPTNLAFNFRRLAGRAWIDPTHVTEWSMGSLRRILEDSPFGASEFRPSFWHRIPWLRPPKRHYSFIVDLTRHPASDKVATPPAPATK